MRAADAKKREHARRDGKRKLRGMFCACCANDLLQCASAMCVKDEVRCCQGPEHQARHQLAFGRTHGWWGMLPIQHATVHAAYDPHPLNVPDDCTMPVRCSNENKQRIQYDMDTLQERNCPVWHRNCPIKHRNPALQQRTGPISQRTHPMLHRMHLTFGENHSCGLCLQW